MIDYKVLLEKYINHIGNCEGVYFIYDKDEMPGFADEEIEELEMLAMMAHRGRLVTNKESQ